MIKVKLLNSDVGPADKLVTKFKMADANLVRKLAKEEGITGGEFVRRAVDHWLERETEEKAA